MKRSCRFDFLVANDARFRRVVDGASRLLSNRMRGNGVHSRRCPPRNKGSNERADNGEPREDREEAH